MKRILGQLLPSDWPISQLSRNPGTSRKPEKPATAQLPPSGARFPLGLQEFLQLIWLTSSCWSSCLPLHSRCLSDPNESRRLCGCERDGNHHFHLKHRTLLISTGCCCCSCSGTVANLVVFSTRMKLILLSLEFHAVPPPHPP